ncbi:MAG: putative ubiquitin-RnfH superfamily antitoxin RatB of RatAB toxin-antitoxin module [Paraglaciecola sp.]|jgi:putative ubiquitin-RnfH superfamily antitoxin RatB of RatAB toxin-antitoxin module
MTDQQISIEVAYALPDRQTLLEVVIEQGTTVEQAIKASGIIKRFPQIDLSKDKVGIWNRTCKLSDEPKNGDRIEVYRPLIADPKEVRRRRAEKAKDEGRANKITGGRA